MARRWLEVTTDEVQSRLAASQQLGARRERMADQAWEAIERWIGPVFQAAGERLGDREYRVAGDSDWSVARCGIYAPGDVEHDPRVAFHEAAFDAYQPLVVLRRKAAGAGATVQTRTLRLRDLDSDALQDFLGD